MSERRHYSGPDLATLLRRVDDELGSDAVIVKADRVRSGGMAGFFAREHYEVVASRPEIDMSTTSSPTPSRDGSAAGRRDEPIGMKPVPTGLAPTLPALTPLNSPTPTALTPAPPATVAPRPSVAASAAPRPARSIQAALLDRADQVSTEELLARAAELTTAERGSESFRSILGRAVADEPGPSLDSPTAADVRRGDPPVEGGPGRRQEPIIGLRPEPVRPGETVIDPLPPEPPDPEAEPTGRERPRLAETPVSEEARRGRRSPDPAGDSYAPDHDGRDRQRRRGDDRAEWYGPAPDGHPAPWPVHAGHDPAPEPAYSGHYPVPWPAYSGHYPAPWPAYPGHHPAPWQTQWGDHPPHWPMHPGPPPPSWGSPWDRGWTPATSDGWSGPAQTQTARPPMPQRCRCPACSQPVPAPAIDSAVLVNSTPAGCPHVHQPVTSAPGRRLSSGSEITVPWWELRREIDDAVRQRVDDIVRALRPAAVDHRCDCGASVDERPTARRRESIQDRPPPPPPPPTRAASRRPAPERRRSVESVIDGDDRGRRPGRAVDDHPRRNRGDRW